MLTINSGYTGAEIRSMMRKHRITIRQLAAKMDVTMKAVRIARNNGPSVLGSLDYAEAIRGYMTDDERVVLRQWQERGSGRF